MVDTANVRCSKERSLMPEMSAGRDTVMQARCCDRVMRKHQARLSFVLSTVEKGVKLDDTTGDGRSTKPRLKRVVSVATMKVLQ